jgi:hypothetical protein
VLEPRDWKGLWHDPRDREVEIAGELSFSQGETQLELVGRLPLFADEPLPPWHLVERRRIRGRTTGGEAITLERCLPRSVTAGRGVPVEVHHADVILIGAYYDLAEDVLFDAISFEFSHFDQWATVSGFATSISWSEEAKTIASLAVTFTPPASIEATLDDGTELSVAFAWSSSAVSQVTTESVIRQNATTTFRFGAPTPLSDAIALGGEFRNFLNLAVGAPVHPRRIIGIVDPPTDARPDPLTRLPEAPLRIEILYQLSDHPDPGALVETRDPHKMLFTLADIIETLGARLDKWRGNYARLKPTFDLFFAVNYGAMRYIDPQFLTLAQALETYDRRTHGRAFPPWVEPDDRKRREPTLRQRLERVHHTTAAVGARIVPDRDAFIEAVVRGRNYYTHYDERQEEHAPEGIELVALTAQLKALTEALLLMELEFSVDEIDAIFKRIDRYRMIDHIRDAVNEHLSGHD